LGVLGRDDGSVVLLVGVLHLVDDTLVGGTRRVEPGTFAARGEVLASDLVVVVPVAGEQLGYFLAVARQTRRLEQVAAVADALRADVGAVADEVARGIRRRCRLPVDPAVGRIGVGHGN